MNKYLITAVFLDNGPGHTPTRREAAEIVSYDEGVLCMSATGEGTFFPWHKILYLQVQER